MLRKFGISTGKILLFFGIWAAGISAATLAVVSTEGPHFFADMRWRIAVEAGGLISALVALIVMAAFVDKRSLSTIGLPARGAVSGFLGGVAIGAVIFSVPVIVLTALGYAHFAFDFSQFSWPLLTAALLLTLVNAADQELLVRSYLFQELWTKYSGAVAVTVSTVIFVSLHAGPISQGMMGKLVGLNILLASVMLGLAYLRSNALWLPIGIHFGWNGFEGPILGTQVTGANLGTHWHTLVINGPALWTGGSLGIEGGLAGFAGPLLGIIIVLTLVPKRTAS